MQLLGELSRQMCSLVLLHSHTWHIFLRTAPLDRLLGQMANAVAARSIPLTRSPRPGYRAAMIQVPVFCSITGLNITSHHCQKTVTPLTVSLWLRVAVATRIPSPIPRSVAPSDHGAIQRKSISTRVLRTASMKRWNHQNMCPFPL